MFDEIAHQRAFWGDSLEIAVTAVDTIPLRFTDSNTRLGCAKDPYHYGTPRNSTAHMRVMRGCLAYAVDTG